MHVLELQLTSAGLGGGGSWVGLTLVAAAPTTMAAPAEAARSLGLAGRGAAWQRLLAWAGEGRPGLHPMCPALV